MRRYGESKTTRIMMATVPHVVSGSGLKKISGRWIFVRQCTWPEEDGLCPNTAMLLPNLT
jgi:hypothetical protein